MAGLVDFEALKRRVEGCAVPVCRGAVTAAGEQLLAAELPGARVGMRVLVEPSARPALTAEVASCDGVRVILIPLAPTTGVGPGDRVSAISGEETVPAGRALLGRIIDPLGSPVDGRGEILEAEPWPLERPAPDPLTRAPVERQLVTGIRAIDGCLCIGLGQRIGLFAGPGLGKSTLLGLLAKRARCDVSVICLVGERGREVREFIEGALGPDGLSRSVVVLAQADAPPLLRARALLAATALAESFRADGQHVLLLVDSLTRAVRARRDLALALGEAPARNGFPASSFAALPSILERAGRDACGSITGVYVVLTESAEGDPVAEEASSLLDGHIHLSPRLARSGHWPAIDLVRSISRVMGAVVSREQREDARKLRRLLSAYEEQEDLILMGAYRAGSSPDTDMAIARRQSMNAFLRQGMEEYSPLEETTDALRVLTSGMGAL